METPHHSRVGSATNYLRLIAYGSLTSPQEVTTTLTNALRATDYRRCVEDLSRVNIDPQSLIDGFDRVGSPLFLAPTILIHGRFGFNLRR